MAHKNFRDTWDYGKARADAIVVCRCGHQRRFTATEFRRLFGKYPVWLILARRRLRCSRCGRRGARVVPMPVSHTPPSIS